MTPHPVRLSVPPHRGEDSAGSATGSASEPGSEQENEPASEPSNEPTTEPAQPASEPAGDTGDESNQERLDTLNATLGVRVQHLSRNSWRVVQTLFKPWITTSWSTEHYDECCGRIRNADIWDTACTPWGPPTPPAMPILSGPAYHESISV